MRKVQLVSSYCDQPVYQIKNLGLVAYKWFGNIVSWCNGFLIFALAKWPFGTVI